MAAECRYFYDVIVRMGLGKWKTPLRQGNFVKVYTHTNKEGQ